MKVKQSNQYSRLKSCLLCYPVNFKINDKSNKYYNKIDYDLLYSQYNNFVNTLSKNSVRINFIDIDKNATQQVFTQDIGFVIQDILFISKMTLKERIKEPEYLKKFIISKNIKCHEMKNNIEGGDVIEFIGGVFVGISSRTSIKAAEELQEVLNKFYNGLKVIPIYFDTSKIHLDCVFNTLDKNSGIISPYVFDKKLISKYMLNLYEISKSDADELGTNYVYLGNNKLLSSNRNVTNLLIKEGYQAELIEYSEIMKGGGSLGCSVMYLLRE